MPCCDHAQNAEDVYGKHYKPGEFLPFYVPRDHMPQVDECYQPRFVSDSLLVGTGTTFEVCDVRQLRAHQRIDHDRAIAMSPKTKLKPIIVSSDGYVIDGNHRWWAHVHGGDMLINVIRLDLPFDAAIKWTLARPYVYEITPTTPERD